MLAPCECVAPSVHLTRLHPVGTLATPLALARVYGSTPSRQVLRQLCLPYDHRQRTPQPLGGKASGPGWKSARPTATGVERLDTCRIPWIEPAVLVKKIMIYRFRTLRTMALIRSVVIFQTLIMALTPPTHSPTSNTTRTRPSWALTALITGTG